MGLITNKANIIYNNAHRELLPPEYKSDFIYSLKIDQLIIVSSRGKLFIYKNSPYKFYAKRSIRGISKNYIGSYDGIFKNNNKIDYPTYTDGWIREFDSKTFICFNGVVLIENEKIIPLKIKVNSKQLSNIWDIYWENKDIYVLFSDFGVFRYKLSTQTILEEIIHEEKDEFNYVGENRNKFDENFNSYYFSKSDSYFEYDLSNQKLIKIKDFYEPVLFVSPDRNKNLKNSFYALFKNGNLIHFKKDDNKSNFQKIILAKNLTDAHTIVTNENYLFIIKNTGLDIYDFETKKIHQSIIEDELNSKAFFITENSLKIGGVYGLYDLNLKILKTFLTNYEIKKEKDEDDLFSDWSSGILIFILSLTIVVLVFIILKRKYLDQQINDQRNKKRIDEFIIKNIKDVSVNNILLEFNMGTHELYKIMGKDKPGKYITKRRLMLVKELRLKNKTDEEISELTGFSVSYLKKI
jgi:hypothetical protein